MLKAFSKSQSLIIAAISIGAMMVALVAALLPVVNWLQLKSVDAMFALRGPVAPKDTSIVVVAIDDQALASLPSKWPFPTFFYSKLVQNLSDAGAKCIIFDIEFTEANTHAPEEDIEFARIVNDSKSGVIFAGKVVFDVGSSGAQSISTLKPIAPLLRTHARWGIVNIIEDSDGFLRRYLLFQKVIDQTYFPLAIEAIRYLDRSFEVPVVDLTQKSFTIAGRKIPKASPNTMYINYRGPAQTFRTYSLATVLDDSTFDLSGADDTDSFELYQEWGTFRDKIVLVGASADELQDNKLTPFFSYEGNRRRIPGVEMHANALSTILRGDFLLPTPFVIVLFLMVLFTTAVSYLTLSIRPFKALAAAVFFLVLIAILAFLLFIKFRLITLMTAPMLSLIFSFITSMVYQTLKEQKEKRRVRQTFQQYVAPSVVEKMLSTGELPSYGGERRLLTVLFSDVRRFTTFSESHEPEIVVSRLSEYLTEMVDVIFKYNGTLDKFVGDEIMALFGAPYFMDDHAEKACLTATEMVHKLREIQKRWSADRKDYFHIGIGINSGKVIVGNLGSSQLFDYTVIGDEVNLGARLEGANKFYQTTIILSENTYKIVNGRARVRELDYVCVMGKTKAIRIYELLAMDELPQIEQDYLIDVYTEGLHAYRERRWADALKSFRRILRYFPSDGPSRIYTVRCLNAIEQPPPDDWDMVHNLDSK